MSTPEEILSTLTRDNARDWQYVGDLMRRLNRISEVSAEGYPWHDVMLDALAAHGHEISSGHLHRIRRAYDFLEEGMSVRKIPKERARIAKISTMDQVERLFQLDPEAGLDALEACLDIAKPATKSDIQKRYEEYLARHPEKKTAMQAAWDRRRSSKEDTAYEADVGDQAKDQSASFATTLRRIADYITELEAASQKDKAKIMALEQEISDMNAEMTETKQNLQIAVDELREIRGRWEKG